MTATLTDPQITDMNDQPSPAVLATWPARAAALALDILPGTAVLATTVLVALSVPLRGVWWWVCATMGALAILWTAFNRLLLAAISGQSLGRAVVGISVVGRGGEPIGPWRLLLRDLAHAVDTAPAGAGWLWPLRDSRRRTFADLLLGTESRRPPAQRADRRPRRLAAVVLLATAMMCAGGASISYTVVRQHDQSIDDARTSIAAQGPHIVAQLLSFHPETIQADFDHAQSLASDKYRKQLSTLQQAARKVGPTANEYWVTRSSVLSAAPDRAVMLLFLQGLRGAPPNQREIAASVRVSFVGSSATGWRVDDVAVVTEPQNAEAKP